MKIEESNIVETNDYRVIIYPASRPFTAKESKKIAEKLYDFLGDWAAHGKELSSSFKIEKNQRLANICQTIVFLILIFNLIFNVVDKQALIAFRTIENRQFCANFFEV